MRVIVAQGTSEWATPPEGEMGTGTTVCSRLPAPSLPRGCLSPFRRPPRWNRYANGGATFDHHPPGHPEERAAHGARRRISAVTAGRHGLTRILPALCPPDSPALCLAGRRQINLAGDRMCRISPALCLPDLSALRVADGRQMNLAGNDRPRPGRCHSRTQTAQPVLM